MTSPSRFQWNELARKPGEVGEALDDFGEVEVVRGTTVLRLSPAPSANIVDVTRALCSVLRTLAERGSESLVREILHEAWPWTRPLPDADVMALAIEAGRVAEMCEGLGSWTPLTEVLNDWRGTARAWSAGMGAVAPIDEPLASAAVRPG